MRKKYILKNKNSNEEKIFTNMLDLKDFAIWEDKNEEWELVDIINEDKIESKQRRNSKTKTVGNGEGSLYYSETLKCWVYQYFDTSNKRKTMKQKKKETVKEFKVRVTTLKNSLNNGTYIEKKQDTIKSILEKHIDQKYNDGVISGNTYNRDFETLKQLEKCCSDLICKPIQKVTFDNIQVSKENMKHYAKSGIDRMWRLLRKAFSIASSPSVHICTVNIMNDENLKKPISNIGTKKIYPLTSKERKKLEHILDNEERYHKYRNIVKMEWITAMRIGELLARSKSDIDKSRTKLHIHNTLTRDKEDNIIIGKHTKTYNKQTEIDEGERYFPINSELKEILNDEISKRVTNIYNLIFWDYENNTFVEGKEINSWLDRLNKKYKISDKKLHNHRLRHDRITQWKESGIDMKAIQYLAGHVEGSDVTDDYIDISQKYAFNEFEKIK